MTPEHPHMDSLKKEFRRHKFGYLVGGLCLGAVIAGTVAASAGHFGAGWDEVAFSDESNSQTVSVTVMETEYEVRSCEERNNGAERAKEELFMQHFCFAPR